MFMTVTSNMNKCGITIYSIAHAHSAGPKIQIIGDPLDAACSAGFGRRYFGKKNPCWSKFVQYNLSKIFLKLDWKFGKDDFKSD